MKAKFSYNQDLGKQFSHSLFTAFQHPVSSLLLMTFFLYITIIRDFTEFACDYLCKVKERLLAMMKPYMKYGITISTFTFLGYSAYALQPAPDNKNKPISFHALYIADNINNVSGGIATGSRYLGMINLNMEFNTKIAGLWNGGHFYINASNTHGAEPSQQLIGDAQVMSNIEAGNHTYLQEIWFKQQLNNFTVTLGLQDLNVEYANSEYAQLYLNSSFGILPIISNNFNAPIFPLTTLGLSFDWNVSERARWINAVYDGSPTNFDNNPHNLKWQLNSGDGLLAISEIQKSVKIKEHPGVYKLGAFYHFHRNRINDIASDSLTNNLIGFYTYIDQVFWEQNQRNAGVFVQFGYTPSSASTNNLYFGTGINITGLLSNKAKDTFGLAVAYDIFTKTSRSETAIELTFYYQLNEYFFIQPDFQYIINPSGTGEPLPDALTANLRLGINF